MDREAMLEQVFITIGNMDDKNLVKVFEFISTIPNVPDFANTRECKSPNCTNIFIPSHFLNVYCSKRCSDWVRNKKQRERRKGLKE